MPADCPSLHRCASLRPGAVSGGGRFFTLIEVLVAAIILAASIGLTLAIVGGARGRILRAEQRWGRAHLLSQVTEFYLAAGPKAKLPDGLLPNGFDSRCDLVVAEDLPQHAAESLSGWTGWRLGVFRITVYDTGGRPLGERVIEKILREDDCY